MAKFQAPGSAYTTESTIKVEVPVHADIPKIFTITEDRLQMITSVRREGLLEAFWGFTGIFFGTFASNWVSIQEAFFVESTTALSGLNLFQIVMGGSSFLLAVCVLVLRHFREKRSRHLSSLITGKKTTWE